MWNFLLLPSLKLVHIFLGIYINQPLELAYVNIWVDFKLIVISLEEVKEALLFSDLTFSQEIFFEWTWLFHELFNLF